MASHGPGRLARRSSPLPLTAVQASDRARCRAAPAVALAVPFSEKAYLRSSAILKSQRGGQQVQRGEGEVLQVAKCRRSEHGRATSGNADTALLPLWHGPLCPGMSFLAGTAQCACVKAPSRANA